MHLISASGSADLFLLVYLLAVQVSLYLGWMQWLLTKAFVNENLVVVNMDETSVSHAYLLRAGSSAFEDGTLISRANHCVAWCLRLVEFI